jgi:hypothetical protein
MMLEQWALVIHVLGWVFWLGTDLGVFLACRYAERSDLSNETRFTLLEVGMVLDRLPRLAVPLVWGSGLILSAKWGYDFIPTTYGLAFAFIWLIATWGIIFQPPGSSLHRLCLGLQTLFYGLLIIGMGAGASWLLYSGGMPLWLAFKWYAYVVIAIAAIALDKYFAPVIVDFQLLATEGSSDSLNEKLSRDIKPVYTMVLVIYAGTLVAGLSGLLKPVL